MIDLFSPLTIVFILILLLCFGTVIIIGATRKHIKRRPPGRIQPSVAVLPKISPLPQQEEIFLPRPQPPPQPTPAPVGRSQIPVFFRTLVITAGVISFLLIVLAVMPVDWFSWLRNFSWTRGGMGAGESLWLEKLSEDRLPGQFRILGQVRNVGRNELLDAQVILKIYGEDGSLLDTAVVPLKEPRLSVQAVSEFSFIYVPGSHSISRYAVSFQGMDGNPLTHKDFRSPPPT